jgi:hypothetical protein
MLANSLLSLYYGTLVMDKVILLTNACNIFIVSWCILFFIRYHSNQSELHITFIIVFGALSAFIFMIEMIRKNDQLLAEQVCAMSGIVICMIMFASPLSLLQTIMNKKDSTGLNPSLAWMSLFCALSWGLYGFMIGNYFVVAPNAFGVLVALCQVILLRLYPASSNIVTSNTSMLGNKTSSNINYSGSAANGARNHSTSIDMF